MKQFRNISMVLLLFSVVFVSCLKDEYPDPSAESIKFYTLNDKGKYEEVTNPKSGVTYTVAVKSKADIITLWPAGERVVKKMADNVTDSIDINGKQVLVKSNHYSDYGLLHAQGLTTSLNEEIGWIRQYKYPTAGNYTITVVATNHGYDSADFIQKIFTFDITMAEPEAVSEAVK